MGMRKRLEEQRADTLKCGIEIRTKMERNGMTNDVVGAAVEPASGGELEASRVGGWALCGCGTESNGTHLHYACISY